MKITGTFRVPFAVACAAALWALAWSGSAAAFETGFYVGGHYGQTSQGIEQVGFDAYNQALYTFFGFTPGPVGTQFDDEDSGYGFLVGYRLFRNLGFEASYADYGKVSYLSSSDGAFDDTPATLDIGLKTRTSGISVSALGFLPLTYGWEVYGRAGVLFSTNELTVFATDGFTSIGGRVSDSSVDYLVGAGLARRFLEIYALRLEFQRVMGVGSDEIGEDGDLDVVSLGISVRF